MTTTPQQTTTHVRPNYMMIWLYLFIMTILEVVLAFELPFSQNVKLILLLILAVWKALLVALFFMHLKFERWRLRLIFIIPIPLALILISAGILEKIW
jgi:cytochrome c oxidase subunit 4